MTINEIYMGSFSMINNFIKEEFRAQGHSHTGAFESSFTPEIRFVGKVSILSVYALRYGMAVNTGLLPSQITKRMIPGLIQYFIQKGYSLQEASVFANRTFKKWKQEGMSTQASKRFSKTGARQNFLESAFTMNEHEINEHITNLFDFSIEQEYRKTKTETI